MAHFAELDENNVVKQIVVVSNEELLDENGNEIEQKGIDFCTNLFGGTWVQTSYNSNFRKVFAGVGYFYDKDADIFYSPPVYASWTLNKETWEYKPPTPFPTDIIDETEYYKWDETTLSWIVCKMESFVEK